ncbi:MAG: hypothetical protein JXX29_20200 [Deltaproteobacteria bacterium]|nr:hypothetical protein [Deltaproteobacteria bacterium]MBN2674015.1 hypothetical protein [Deltaproteobacteria bacterium]
MNKKTLVILLGAALLLFGCAGKVKEPTSPQAPGSEFVAPDMEETEGIEGYEDVQLGPEDNQIIVPGANYGRAPGFKKKGKKAKVNANDPSYWPKTEGVADLMEGFEWGMTVKKVFSIFEAKIREKYNTEMSANSGDLLAEDRIRAKMHAELNKVKDSYVSFNGQTTGYESHMVDVEFTHNNNESMLVWDAGKYVEYLFFINNRFWKRVRLFRIDKLGGITLDEFNGSMENVLGCKGAEVMDDQGNLVKIAWRDDDTFVSVLDGSKFFGVYGLRLSSAVTETYLSKLRQNKGKSSGAVDSSISSTIDAAVNSVDYNDQQESVIDQYTGKAHDGNLSHDPNSSDGGFSSQKKGNDAQPAEPAPKQEEPNQGDLDDLF